MQTTKILDLLDNTVHVKTKQEYEHRGTILYNVREWVSVTCLLHFIMKQKNKIKKE
jgi:hypothetical protein